MQDQEWQPMGSRPTNRRQFLSAASWSSSSLWLATQTQAQAQAQETPSTALPQTASDADREIGPHSASVRVAVVGTGARGSDLIRALSTIPQAQLVGVCDTYEPHLVKGSQYAGPDVPAFRDFQAMLRQTQPQAVVVATPLASHFEICVAAIDAGCDVFCEKMMCQTLPQARDLVRQVEAAGVVFQVGLQRRANAIYRQAVAMVQTGLLGQITAIKCQWHRHHSWRRPIPVDRHHPDWANLEHQLNWRLYRQTSQGLLAELASHQLDVVHWMLGCLPRRVLGCGGIDYWRDGREVFDNVFCIYEYEVPPPKLPRRRHQPPGPEVPDPTAATPLTPYTVRVTYSSLQNNAYEGASELILGTRGTLYLTQKKGLFFQEPIQEAATKPQPSATSTSQDPDWLTAGKTLKLTNDPWTHRGKPYEIDTDSDDTRAELVAFLDSVQLRTPTICAARIGLANTATVVLANQAMQEGTPVAFPTDLLS